MVSAFGYYASAKGMVLVPNLSGLTRTNAITAIQNAGLTPVAGSVVNTGDSGLDDIIASQNPSSGTLVNYETSVQYDYYDFVPAPPFFPPSFTPTPPFFPPSFTPFFPPSFTPQTSVPNIVGLTVSEASSALSSVGLSLGSDTGDVTSGATSGNNGKIATQNPTAGSSVAPGSSINYETYLFLGASGVWYTYCGNVSAGYAPGQVVGPAFVANTTCQAQFDLLTSLSEIGGGWNCAPGFELASPSVSPASCTSPNPFFPPSFPFFPPGFGPFFPPSFPFFPPSFPFFPPSFSTVSCFGNPPFPDCFCPPGAESWVC